MSKLKTLAEHNAEIQDIYAAYGKPRLNGIACPLCGEELEDSDNYTMTSSPPQKNVKCSKCVWTGYRLT